MRKRGDDMLSGIGRAGRRVAQEPSTRMRDVRLVMVTGLIALNLAAPSAPGQAPSATQCSDEITLELIMSDQDWMGNSPESPYWADDGRSIYYVQKRQGSED